MTYHDKINKQIFEDTIKRLNKCERLLNILANIINDSDFVVETINESALIYGLESLGYELDYEEIRHVSLEDWVEVYRGVLENNGKGKNI